MLRPCISAVLAILAIAVATRAQDRPLAELGAPIGSAPPAMHAEGWPAAADPIAGQRSIPIAPREGTIELLPRFELTDLIKFGNRGFGVTDIDGKVKIRVPLDDSLPPLEISPGTAIRLWYGPDAIFPEARANSPLKLYDVSADIGWRPRPAEWLFIDLQITPGLYTDFKNVSIHAFRPRGHAVGIFALSEEFQILAGLAYINRINTKIIPVGGFRYAPSEDTEFLIVLPVPRISHHIFDIGRTRYQLFLQGEFGGGSWAIQRVDGSDDVVGYNDYRVILGLEAEMPSGRRWQAGIGYVFGRSISFSSDVPPAFKPGDTLLFRVGLQF